MSLWIALIWLVCAVICVGTFLFCRKRLADIAQQVSEEFQNCMNRFLLAEHNAEAQLLDAFSNFSNSAAAIQTYQKTVAEIFRSHQAKPPWNWSLEDLQLWLKCAEGKERAGLGRPVILAVAVIILALNTAAAVTSVITLNNVRPVMMAQTSPIGAATTKAEQLPPPISLPPLPTAWSTSPQDDNTNLTNFPSSDVNRDTSDCNTAELGGFKSKGAENEN